MTFSIGINPTANHPLILRPMFLRFTLNKLHATFTQCKHNLHPLFLNNKILWPGKKVLDDLQISEQFIHVDNKGGQVDPNTLTPLFGPLPTYKPCATEWTIEVAPSVWTEFLDS